ncbi:unnamed protein product [Parnassius apollo]|uniref:(apollo) hypothetical protein n=1 Tax=Parnassius apollo TaxID=110799 RepID=A0A8S3WK70_PARAO|nr:unnamed protein product [Parnassius apollo]
MRKHGTQTKLRLCFAVEIRAWSCASPLEAIDSVDVRGRHIDGAGTVMERESSAFCSARFRNMFTRGVRHRDANSGS